MEYTTHKALAERFGIDRTGVTRYIKKIGFKSERIRDTNGSNQMVLAVTNEDAKAIIKARVDAGFKVKGEAETLIEAGYKQKQIQMPINPAKAATKLKKEFSKDELKQLLEMLSEE